MTASLMLAALLMGLAGSLHCTAMCGAACSAITGRRGSADSLRAQLGFHGGRLLSYAAGGLVAAASVNALGAWSQAAPALRPLWSLVHAAALMLGLWLVWAGRQPAWLMDLGRAPQPAAGGWQAMNGPLRPALAGSAWVLLPCGLLQSALLVAALASDAVGGALVMAVFATASSLGLLLASAAWQRTLVTPQTMRWAVRLAGAMLTVASAWALGHGLWLKIAAYCFA